MKNRNGTRDPLPPSSWKIPLKISIMFFGIPPSAGLCVGENTYFCKVTRKINIHKGGSFVSRNTLSYQNQDLSRLAVFVFH